MYLKNFKHEIEIVWDTRTLNFGRRTQETDRPQRTKFWNLVARMPDLGTLNLSVSMGSTLNFDEWPGRNWQIDE